MWSCKRCGGTERYKGGECASCARARYSAAQTADSNYAKEKSAAYRAANLQRVTALQAAYYAAHRDRLRAVNVAWRVKNADSIRAKAADKAAEVARKRKERRNGPCARCGSVRLASGQCPQCQRASRLRRFNADPDKARAERAAYRAANRDKIQANKRRRRRESPEIRASHALQSKRWRENNIERSRANNRVSDKKRVIANQTDQAWSVLDKLLETIS